MIDGLNNYLDDKGFASVNDIVGLSAKKVTTWGDLDLSYKTVAKIDHTKCIQCTFAISRAKMARTSASRSRLSMAVFSPSSTSRNA